MSLPPRFAAVQKTGARLRLRRGASEKHLELFESDPNRTDKSPRPTGVNRFRHEKVVCQLSRRALPAPETVFPKVSVTPETVPCTVLPVPVTASPAVFPAP